MSRWLGFSGGEEDLSIDTLMGPKHAVGDSGLMVAVGASVISSTVTTAHAHVMYRQYININIEEDGAQKR